MANAYGDFDVGLVSKEMDAELYLLYDEDILASLDLSSLVPASEQDTEMVYELKTSDMDGLPPPETPACAPASKPETKRFRSMSEIELKQFQDARHSKSTKRNTKWGIQMFQDWHVEVFGTPLDFEKVETDELANKLRKFFCEAKPKESNKSKYMMDAQSGYYHKNTLKNIRSAINRHLQDIGRSIDIVRDKEFKSTNHTLDGMLKTMTKIGASRPTKHKAVINSQDLHNISSYLRAATFSPLVLRQCVWYHLSIHFVTRGLEFHHQLRRDSFEFHTDENGLEYVTLRQETQQKNFQGGIESEEAPSDKRMYSSPESETCPVKMLRLLVEKTDKNASFLFNSCMKEALTLSASSMEVWYAAKPLTKRTFSGFMADISKSAKCSIVYTPHCLRATAITAMSEAGFEARQIMFMSGHRCESSLQSYNKNLSSEQKLSVSACLSSLTHPKDQRKQPTSTTTTCRPTSVSENATATRPDDEHAIVPFQNVENHDRELNVNMIHPSSVNSLRSSEFLSKSVFNNCVFNFK